MEWNTSTAYDELIYSPTMTQRSPSWSSNFSVVTFCSK